MQIAAKNCRNRKNSQVNCLQSQLVLMRERKEIILRERVRLLCRKQEWVRRVGRLEKEILSKMGREQRDWMINVNTNVVTIEMKKADK